MKIACRQGLSARLPVFPPSTNPVRAFPGLEGLSVGRVFETKGKGSSMALYEHVFMARQDVTAPQVEALTEQFKALIAAQGGSVSKVEAWGLKSLAFRIKKNRKA